MTALGLAREGVSVTLLEVEDDIVYSPRAISYAWSILPALELFGVLDDMITAGHIVDDRCWRIFRTGETIVYNHDAVRDITDRPYSLTLGQDLLARVVLQHLKRYPNASIHWGTKFVGLTQTPDKVIVTAEKAGAALEFAAKLGGGGGRRPERGAQSRGVDDGRLHLAATLCGDEYLLRL